MDLTLGILLVAAGGAMEGLFSLGVTNTPKWRWENIWGLGSLVALVLVPWPVAFLTVPDLLGVYRSVPGETGLALVFGLGWGIGSIFWGKAINIVGLALGVSMMMGMTSVWGALGPLLLDEPGQFLKPGGMVLSLALLVMVAGVAFCALAGKKKETDLAGRVEAESSSTTRTSAAFAVGLLFCMLSPLLSSLVNFAFTQCSGLKEASIAAGAGKASQSNAIWAMVFTGNFSVNCAYTLVLMFKNKSFGRFAEGDAMHWFWALFLGTLWPLGIVLYGIGATRMGEKYGAYAGWPMMLLCSILASNVAGAATGEWRGTRPQTRKTMLSGIAVLLVALGLLAAAKMLMGSA